MDYDTKMKRMALDAAIEMMPPIFAGQFSGAVARELVHLQTATSNTVSAVTNDRHGDIPHHVAAAALAYSAPIIMLQVGAMIAAANHRDPVAAKATAEDVLGQLHAALDYAFLAGSNAGAQKLREATVYKANDGGHVAALVLPKDDAIIAISKRLALACGKHVKF